MDLNKILNMASLIVTVFMFISVLVFIGETQRTTFSHNVGIYQESKVTQ